MLRAIAQVDPRCFDAALPLKDVVHLVDMRDVAMRFYNLRIDWKLISEISASIGSVALILFKLANPEVPS